MPHELKGSGRKVRPQKGSGKARWANLRGSGKLKPGKSWGARPRDYTQGLPL